MTEVPPGLVSVESVRNKIAEDAKRDATDCLFGFSSPTGAYCYLCQTDDVGEDGKRSIYRETIEKYIDNAAWSRAPYLCVYMTWKYYSEEIGPYQPEPKLWSMPTIYEHMTIHAPKPAFIIQNALRTYATQFNQLRPFMRPADPNQLPDHGVEKRVQNVLKEQLPYLKLKMHLDDLRKDAGTFG